MRWCVLLLPLLLAGCLEDEHLSKCFDIIDVTRQPAQPILLNRCTGETWIAIQETLPKREDQLTASYVLRWYKIHHTDVENGIAGMEKRGK